MKRISILSLLFALFFATGLSAQQTALEGRWKTIDEDTGQAKSIIEIYKDGKTYSGRIAEILTGNDGARCTECDGKKKNAPILGMVIIEDLVPSGEPAYWKGGTIFDPQKGADYRLSVWIEEDKPNTLYVRGKHWTGLYRTQEWIRE